MRRRYIHPHIMFRGRRGFGHFGWGWFWLLSPLALLSLMFWPFGIILLIAVVIYALTRRKDEDKEKNATYILPPSSMQAIPAYGAPAPIANQTYPSKHKERHFNYCPNCGSKLDGVYTFCPHCGYNLQQ